MTAESDCPQYTDFHAGERVDAWCDFFWLLSLPRKWKLIYRALTMPRYIAAFKKVWGTAPDTEGYVLNRALYRRGLTMQEWIEGVTLDENRHMRMYQELPLCCYHWIKGQEPLCGGTCERCTSDEGMACPPVCRGVLCSSLIKDKRNG